VYEAASYHSILRARARARGLPRDDQGYLGIIAVNCTT